MKTQSLIETAIRILSLSDCEVIKELAGKSGAHVTGCNVKRSDFSGEAVLKFNLHGDANAQGIPTEAAKNNELIRIAPQFASRYVPSLIASNTIDGTTVSMYDVAGLNLQSVRTLASLEGLDAMQVLQHVAALLIEGIDTGPEVGDRTETAQSMLKTWLDYRLEPKKGRIYDYFHEELHIDPLISNLTLGSRMLPNPYAFAVREDGSSLPTYDLRPICGYAHGDLHGDNILVDRFLMARTPISTRHPILKIIDFAQARSTWPLFFDHAHLELNEILRHFEHLDISQWLEFLDTLSKISHLSHLRSILPPVIGIYALRVRSRRSDSPRACAQFKKITKPSAL